MDITINQLYSRPHLEKAWKIVRKGKSKEQAKKSKGCDKQTLEDFGARKSYFLEEVEKELREGTYKPGKIKIVLIPKEKPIKGVEYRGKYRMIAVPNVRDRVVQQAILLLIQTRIAPRINNGVSYCVYNEKKKNCPKNLKTAVATLITYVRKKKYWVFETDIQAFYDNIPKERLLEDLFSCVPLDNALKALIREFIYFEICNEYVFEGKPNISKPKQDSGITQGSAFSPILSNLYLADFDITLKNEFGERYIRYVDDLIIMCEDKEEAEKACDLANQEIAKLDLQLAESKTHICNLFQSGQKINFLGLAISRERIAPKKKAVELKEQIKEIIRDPDNVKTIQRKGKEMDRSARIEEKLLAIAKYYSCYHIEEIYPGLDGFIQSFIRTHYKDIKLGTPFKSVALMPLIPLKEWQSLFMASEQ